MRVLITNAEYKHTLAAVRSLGKKEVDFVASSHAKHAMSFYSKYCKKSALYSNPKNESKFISNILEIVKKENCDVLLPIGFTVCLAISKHQEKLKPYVKIPIPNYESMLIASDKNKTMKFADENDIPIPKTIFPISIEDVNNISKSIKYPVVIKAPEESGSVKYANSDQELIILYNEVCNSHASQVNKGKFPQIQEYIPGDGYGFFALFNHGKPIAYFAHKRLHEYPPTGGPSTMAQSIYDLDLISVGLKILKTLDWHGVAMVEFKKDTRDNTFKLIEINPKFWGSLDLAIASGIDFPYLASKMCIDENIEPIFEYNRNLIFRWIFPDLVYSLANNTLKEYMANFLNSGIKDDLYLSDIKPSIIQCYSTMIEIALRIKNRTLKHPHGKPNTNDS